MEGEIKQVTTVPFGSYDSCIDSRRVATKKPQPWIFRAGGRLHFRPRSAWGWTGDWVIVESRGRQYEQVESR